MDMVEGINPFDWNLSPTGCIVAYAVVCVARSTLIMMSLCMTDYINRNFQPLALAFPLMFSTKTRKLWCFDLDITHSGERARIKSAAEWMTWTIAVAVICYLSHTAIMYYRTFPSNSSFLHRVDHLCHAGFHCFLHADRLIWRIAQFEPICDDKKKLVKSEEFGYITCVGILVFDADNLLMHSAVAAALCHMFAVLFQGITWLLYRWETKIPSYFTLALSIFWATGFVTFSFVTTFLDSWAAYPHTVQIVWLAFPMLLFCAYMSAIALHELRQRRRRIYARHIKAQPIENLDAEEVLSHEAVVRLCEGCSLHSPLAVQRSVETDCTTTTATPMTPQQQNSSSGGGRLSRLREKVRRRLQSSRGIE